MAEQRVLGDRYRIDATLGQGGMARVYRGTDRVLNRAVAVKVLADRYATDDNFVTRFRREAQASAALNHPNIVSVYDTGSDDGAHYIVMEFVDGHTLGDLMRREGPLPPDRAAEIGVAVATALEAAHDKGLVHRDVKPGNVMLTVDGQVKVMDFGIARAATDDTLTQTGLVLGTASYLSPEQVRGDPVDERSDVYSLGCVLYETLAGRPPFTGETPVSIAYKHVNQEPRPLAELREGIPRHLDAVVMKAMAKDPADRYQTAAAFRDALVAALGSAGATAPFGAAGAGDTAVLPPVSAGGEALPAEGPPSRRRGWWLPAALFGAAVFLIAGLLLLTLLSDGREAGRRRDRGAAAEQPSPEETSAPAQVPSVDDAFTVLEEAVSSAVSAGQMSVEAADKVLEPADKAAEEYAGGDLDKALEELGKADEELNRSLEEGEVSEDAATAIDEAIDLVAAAMQAAAPAVPEEDGGEEEGGQEEGGEQGEGGGPPPHAEDKGKGNGNGDD